MEKLKTVWYYFVPAGMSLPSVQVEPLGQGQVPQCRSVWFNASDEPLTHPSMASRAGHVTRSRRD
eukprot:3683133-Rhodomonas_salina.1